MSALKDLTGQRFGRLTVLSRYGSTNQGTATWSCLCDCGRNCIAEGAKMRKGNTKSCGCLHDDLARARMTTHGKSQTRLYHVWKTMIQRCENPNEKNYFRYGGRGISVCEEWKEFSAFYEWAVLNGYSETAETGQCTIDRIDNEKGYSPNNCRWVDMKTQNNNKSNSKGALSDERYSAH